MMKYKGCMGIVEYYSKAIDDYISWCKEDGVEPMVF